MADETIVGRAVVELRAENQKLKKDLEDARAGISAAMSKVERDQAKASKAIQGQLDKLNATKATRQIEILAQAVQKAGGVAALSGNQLGRLTAQVNSLAAAGAKVPASLAGLERSTSGLSAAFRSLTSGGGVAGGLAALGPAGVTAAAGVAGVTAVALKAGEAISDLAKRGSQLSDLSAKTQIGVESLQRMAYAGSLVGVSIETIAGASLKLDRALVDSPEKFAKLGLSVQQLLAMNPEQRFETISATLRALPDGPIRTAAAFDLLGKSAGEVLPFLTSNLAEAHEEASRLGLVLDKETVAAADALDDALTRLGAAADAFKMQLAAIALGSADGAKGIDDLAAGVGSLAGYISENRAAFELLLKVLGKVSGLSQLGQLPTLVGLVAERGPRPKTPIWKPGEIVPPSIDFAGMAARAQVVAGRGAAGGKEEREAAAAAKKAADEMLAVRKKYNELQVSIVKNVRDEADTLHDLDEISKGLLANQQQIAAGQLSALKETRLRGGDMLPAVGGAGLWTKHQDVLDQELENAAEQTKKVAEETKDWTSTLGTLADNLNVLAQTTGGLTGKIVGFAASLASGLGGVVQGFNAMKDAKGPLAFLGKAAGAIGMVGSIVGTGISLFKGIKSLFGGKSKEQKAAEAAAKKQAADEAKAVAIEQAQKRQAAGEQARGFAEALSEKIAAGGLSEKLSGALSVFVGKMNEALGKLGLGVVDARLKDSEKFQAASGVAGDVAGGLKAASEAGIVDAGLLGATSGAAAAIQEEAIAAAREAGLSDMEAAKQGSLAIAQILREQLNASIRSGQDLDSNTQALLEEAKRNGITILADPMVESLGVQKQQLDVLQKGFGVVADAIGEAGTGGEPSGAVPPAAAQGFNINPDLAPILDRLSTNIDRFNPGAAAAERFGSPQGEGFTAAITGAIDRLDRPDVTVTSSPTLQIHIDGSADERTINAAVDRMKSELRKRDAELDALVAEAAERAVQ